MKYRLTTILMFGVLSTLGCASIQDVNYKASHCLQAHLASTFAPRCPHFNSDYKCGFSQGYYDYSMNRKCKPPTIPPKEYWKAKYENPRGQQQIEAWYRGYEMGMLASEQDCGNCWHRLHPHGLLTFDSPLAYPTNSTPMSDEQLDMPHPSNGRQTDSERIPAPIPVPQQEEIGLFPAPEVEIQPTAYEAPTPVASSKSVSVGEPPRLDVPTREAQPKGPLFAPPPVPR